MALAYAPKLMKTTEKPPPNATEEASSLLPEDWPARSCSIPMPDNIKTYPSTRGRMRGAGTKLSRKRARKVSTLAHISPRLSGLAAGLSLR
jgi:hypothetical protein